MGTSRPGTDAWSKAFCGPESEFLGADANYISCFGDMQLLSGDLERIVTDVGEHS